MRDTELEYIEHMKEAPLRLIIVSLDASSPHWHEEYEVVFALRGTVTVSVEREACTMSSGDVYVINPREVHAFRKGAGSNICLILQFSPSVIHEVYERSFIFKLNTAELAEGAIVAMRRLLADMGLLLHNKPDGYQFMIRGGLYGFIGCMFRYARYAVASPEELVQSAAYLGDFDVIKRYIKLHFGESIDQATISQDIGMSRAKVYRVLKAAGAASTRDMTNYYRVEHAKHLLRNTDQSISSIATDSGFDSDSSFYRVFHDLTGASPQEYRKQPVKKTALTGIQGYAQYSIPESLALLKRFTGGAG